MMRSFFEHFRAFPFSFFLFSILFQFALADSRVLRPCFERYANHRLVNVLPYHSEWRMRTEDSCLLFCAQSSSRCKSVVYDTVQHICHYFSDEGVDQAVIAAKMTYLRVVDKSCLDDGAETAADPNNQAPPNAPPVLLTSPSFEDTNQVIQQESSTQPTPSVTIESPEKIEKDEKTMVEEGVEDGKKIVEEELDDELKKVLESVENQQFNGKFDDESERLDKNGVYRDKSGNDQADQWINSQEKMHRIERKKPTISQKFNELKKENPKKYESLIEDQDKKITENVDENVESAETQKLKANLRYGAKVIKFDEEAAYRKQAEFRRKPVSTTSTPTRRPQLRPVTISSTSYLEKAKLFLAELNEKPEGSKEIITTQCENDDVAVWVSFENSRQDDEVIDDQIDEGVSSRRDCQRFCDQNDCRSFTYFETTRKCHLSTVSDGVTLSSPIDGDFTASTSTKFCYPKSFSVFDGCSNFVAFRDYSVRMLAAEEFDGLPRGYDGMQLCIELCVLSTRYTCRSSTFNPITGKCRLLTDDSLTNPDEFKFDEFQKEIYIENGCTSSASSFEDHAEFSDRHVEVMTSKPKKIKKRTRRVKKMRRRRV